MKKLFQLKEWLPLVQAASHLSSVLEDEVTVSDLYRYARQNLLTLSVYFPELTAVKYGEILRKTRDEINTSLASNSLPSDLRWHLLTPKGAMSLPRRPEEAEGEDVLVIRNLKIDAEHYVRFGGAVNLTQELWDLPMIGGEQLDIEDRYQQLENKQAVTSVALEGVIIRDQKGELCQLQDQLTVREFSSLWDIQHRSLKQRINDGEIGKKEGERLINLHKEERKRIIQTIKTLLESETYYPAARLPKASSLVVRRTVLQEFVQRVIGSTLEPNNSTAESGQNQRQADSCEAVNAGKIKIHFKVKTDPDENYAWWKKMMRNASDNGLARCRVGVGAKGPGGSLWRPDLVAGWLVDRHKKDRDGGLNKKAAGVALKQFAGCEEIADTFFSPDE